MASLEPTPGGPEPNRSPQPHMQAAHNHLSAAAAVPTARQLHQRHITAARVDPCGQIGVLCVPARLAPDVHPDAMRRSAGGVCQALGCSSRRCCGTQTHIPCAFFLHHLHNQGDDAEQRIVWGGELVGAACHVRHCRSCRAIGGRRSNLTGHAQDRSVSATCREHNTHRTSRCWHDRTTNAAALAKLKIGRCHRAVCPLPSISAPANKLALGNSIRAPNPPRSA